MAVNLRVAEISHFAAVAAADPQLGQALINIRSGLDEAHFIDFSLMIRLAVEALRADHPDALQAVGPLEHLMVDEYQDINTAQEALIGEMHKQSKTLFVVGDDEQAIYAWRGADIGNIISFDQRYPDSSAHTLPHNFRSTPAIVESADAFAHEELLGTIYIERYGEQRGLSPGDFAILMRSVRQASKGILRHQAFTDSSAAVLAD